MLANVLADDARTAGSRHDAKRADGRLATNFGKASPALMKASRQVEDRDLPWKAAPQLPRLLLATTVPRRDAYHSGLRRQKDICVS
jgi:hypothetical protein